MNSNDELRDPSRFSFAASSLSRYAFRQWSHILRLGFSVNCDVVDPPLTSPVALRLVPGCKLVTAGLWDVEDYAVFKGLLISTLTLLNGNYGQSCAGRTERALCLNLKTDGGNPVDY